MSDDEHSPPQLIEYNDSDHIPSTDVDTTDGESFIFDQGDEMEEDEIQEDSADEEGAAESGEILDVAALLESGKLSHESGSDVALP